MNGEYLKAMDEDRFYEMALPYMEKLLPDGMDTKKISSMIKTRIETFEDIEEQIDFFAAVPEYDISLYTHKKMKTNPENSLTLLQEVLPVLQNADAFDNDSLFELLKEFAAEKEYKTGYVMWPIRTALSGKAATPGGATELLSLLGKEESINRINAAINKLQQ